MNRIGPVVHPDGQLSEVGLAEAHELAGAQHGGAFSWDSTSAALRAKSWRLKIPPNHISMLLQDCGIQRNTIDHIDCSRLIRPSANL